MRETLSECPSCKGTLKIAAYQCPSCGTEVRGRFSGCPFCRMSDEDRYFSLVFLQCEGSIKDVERIMGISYPTVKNRLAQVLRHFEGRVRRPKRDEPAPAPPEPSKGRDVIGALEKGEIDFAKAMEMLKASPERQ